MTSAGPGTAWNVTRDTPLATSLEVASSFWALFRGLMGRRELPAGTGLWLNHTNNIHMMFMRFPIDAVFLGRPGTGGTRTVVAIRRRLPRWTGVVWFARGADGVIELPAGTIDSSGTTVGDIVRLSVPAGG